MHRCPPDPRASHGDEHSTGETPPPGANECAGWGDCPRWAFTPYRCQSHACLRWYCDECARLPMLDGWTPVPDYPGPRRLNTAADRAVDTEG